MKSFTILFASFLSILIGSSSAEPVPNDMQLFLLIGQSNMAGRGKVEPQDTVTSSRIFMLTKEKQWTLAKDPVHFDKPVAGVGLCSEFARLLVKEDATITVGLIPCAVGGTSLDQWKPAGLLYTNAVKRARVATKSGKLAGILWHQGESDSAHEKVVTYAERFTAMITQLRKDLHAEDVPVVIGELGHFRAASAELNAILPDVARAVPLCVLVTADGLKDKGDLLHFGSTALRTFGQRYAAAYLKLTSETRSQRKN